MNIADNTTAHLAFSFVDHYDDWELPLDKFYLSFFDVDQQRDPRRHRERLCVDHEFFDEYVIPDTSELKVTVRDTKCDGSYGPSTTFESTAAGFECDNPTDPNDLGVVPCSQWAQ